MKIFQIIIFTAFLCLKGFGQLKVGDLRCENRTNPSGIDINPPRFSWKLESDRKNVKQTAYSIRVFSEDKISWQSGKLPGSQSVFVPYKGPALVSGAKYKWQVQVWDNQGNESGWSPPSYWQMGLLHAGDWKAGWIETGAASDTVNGPAQRYRRDFQAKGKIRSATIFMSAHGVYEAFLNGKPLSENKFAPGWTSYGKRLQYQVYDVTSLVDRGTNALAITIGSGWYRTPLAWNNNRNLYGTKTGLLLQLVLEYSNGAREIIVTDDQWKTSDAGPVRASEIYNGEIFDDRLADEDWKSSAFSANAEWKPAVKAPISMGNLVATYNEPVRAHEIFHPVHIFKTPKGELVADFGQNLVGYEELKLKGQAGERIVVNHAEVLDKEGNFYTENLRAARSENIYFLHGKGQETLHPHFTFHGFRFIKISGYSGDLKNDDLSAVVLHSDMDTTGFFSCSNPLLNQLQHNIRWGQKGNFLDVPTDCPQRDERLGWTGDAQAFSATAAFNMGVHNFFAKWLKDVSADQGIDGMVPFVVPNVLGPQAGGSAGWADVSTIIPWNMWLAYGDIKILSDQYPGMKAWVEFMHKHSTDDLWNTGFHFGDWLFYRPFDDNDGRSAVTDKYLIAQCFYAHSTQLLINAAGILNKTDDIAYYTALLNKIKAAFVREYLTPSGRLVSGTQTAYTLALQFDLLPENLREQAARRLAENIRDYNDHITTGFLGTPYICHVLSRYGYDSLAYRLLLQDTYPSWLYPVKMGATTIWERWDGQKPDSSFQTPSMNSFNHYAYGAIGDWMYRNIAGLQMDEQEGAGYKKIIIKPCLSEKLDYADCSLESVYGTISVQWRKKDGKLNLLLRIPPNTTAKIYLPAMTLQSVMENGRPLGEQKDIALSETKDKLVILETGSGVYQFSSDIPK